jgi:HSF-type DNA-binding
MLKEVEEAGESDVAAFFSHGRAFAVHDMDRFVSSIMPRFFKQSKWNSFGTYR